MPIVGDFRQILPVVPQGTKADEINACLKMSPLWGGVVKLSLSTNIRVLLQHDVSANSFSKLLLSIGEDTLDHDEDGRIKITNDLGVRVENVAALIEVVYPYVEEKCNLAYLSWWSERSVLVPRNCGVNALNEKLLDKLPATETYYYSIDTTSNVEQLLHYPIEFLNSIDPPGFPAHKLVLKVGAPIILLRNVKPPKLCNGTRLMVINLQNNLIEAVIMNGSAKGEAVFIPRIPVTTNNYPIEFKRLQFPVKLCFAMTINKAQGQSLSKVGLDLTEDCFTHGQLYVACSRVGKPTDLCILTQRNLKNIVYKQLI